jgi:hypothetical protein
MSCLHGNYYVLASSPSTGQKMVSFLSGAITLLKAFYIFLIVCNFLVTFLHEARIILVLSAGFLSNK